MSAHTPGPWKVEDDGREVVVYAVEGSCRVASIELDNLDDRSHALRDARLIAAAPDLLADAKDLLDLLDDADLDEEGMALFRRVRANVARAEGRE